MKKKTTRKNRKIKRITQRRKNRSYKRMRGGGSKYVRTIDAQKMLEFDFDDGVSNPNIGTIIGKCLKSIRDLKQFTSMYDYLIRDPNLSNIDPQEVFQLNLPLFTKFYKEKICDNFKKMVKNLNKTKLTDIRNKINNLFPESEFKSEKDLETFEASSILSQDDFSEYLQYFIERKIEIKKLPFIDILPFRRLALSLLFLEGVIYTNYEKKNKKDCVELVMNEPTGPNIVTPITQGIQSPDAVYTFDLRTKDTQVNATPIQKEAFNAVKVYISNPSQKGAREFCVANKNKGIKVTLVVKSNENGKVIMNYYRIFDTERNKPFELTDFLEPPAAQPPPVPAQQLPPAPAQQPQPPVPPPSEPPQPPSAPPPSEPPPSAPAQSEPPPSAPPAPEPPAPAQQPPLGLSQEEYTKLQTVYPDKVISTTVIRFAPKDPKNKLEWKNPPPDTKLSKSHNLCDDAPDRTQIRLFNDEPFSVEHIDKIDFTVSPYDPNKDTDKDLMSKLLTRLMYITDGSKPFYCNTPGQQTYYIKKDTSETGFSTIILEVIDQDGIISQCLVVVFKDNDSINVEKYIQNVRRKFLEYISKNIQVIQASILVTSSITVTPNFKIKDHPDHERPTTTYGYKTTLHIYVKDYQESLYDAPFGTKQYGAFNEIQLLTPFPLPSYRINPKNPIHTVLFVRIVSKTPLVIELQESNVGNLHTKVTRQLISNDFEKIKTIGFPTIPPDILV